MTICLAERGRVSWAWLPQQTFLVDVSLAFSPFWDTYSRVGFVVSDSALVVCATFKIKHTLVHSWATHVGSHKTRADDPHDRLRNVKLLLIHFIINYSLSSHVC